MLRRAFTAVSLCLPAALLGQGHFEGVITARLSTSGQGSSEVAYSIKGDQLRLDMTGRGAAMAMLHDAAKNTTYMVMTAQRIYMDMSQMGADAQGAVARKTADIKMTGKKETVAGVECEHALVTGDDGQFDVCVARGMGTFSMMSNPMGGRGASAPSASWSKLGRDVFPLKVQKVGGELAYEVVKLEKKPLDASLFIVPDDFQKLDMGGRRGRPPE